MDYTDKLYFTIIKMIENKVEAAQSLQGAKFFLKSETPWVCTEGYLKGLQEALNIVKNVRRVLDAAEGAEGENFIDPDEEP